VCAISPLLTDALRVVAVCPIFHSGSAQGLYASLPATLTTFVADIESLCRGGLVDTKYIADYHARDPASFLEYLFRSVHLARSADQSGRAWRVACGVWRVACGVWRVACGVWRVACGVWRVACGVWRALSDSLHAAIAGNGCGKGAWLRPRGGPACTLRLRTAAENGWHWIGMRPCLRVCVEHSTLRSKHMVDAICKRCGMPLARMLECRPDPPITAQCRGARAARKVFVV
jgi:hypothetical protein